MTTVNKLVGSGLAPLAAQQICGDLNSAVAAAGTTQLTATILQNDINYISSGGYLSGVMLQFGGGITTAPSATNIANGSCQDVFNGAGNPIYVYPPVGGTINGGAVNAPVSMMSGFGMRFIQTAPLTFMSVSSALPSFNTAVAAAGSTQGTATQLLAQINFVTTVSSSTGVILPNISSGFVYVQNGQGTNALAVYPPSGGAINAGTANASVSLPANKGALFFIVGVNSGTVAGV